ncbi:hypothetical protein EZV62_004091 [Acer yangbiense]|uniref:Reverse transcriptase zinc-binding domain-containing protein n=1 Tax=Acer yangbiense TaxID=1000413 RepID=A0A5C7IL09_9ROSI|nr:hypothetical protein EZV62_004091 [Acer yangbiense]
MVLEDLCPICARRKETSLHALWHCSSLKEVRTVAKIDDPGSGLNFASFFDFVLFCQRKMEVDVFEFFCVVWWRIWYRRNNFFHSNIMLLGTDIISWAEAFAADFQGACSRDAHLGGNLGGKAGVSLGWKAPSQGFYKINTNAALNEELKISGVGVVIRDWKGNVMASLSQQIDGAWPLLGHLPLLGGKIPVCKILGAMADKYGPIFSLKLGKYPTLMVSSWEIAKDCLVINDKILATRPRIAFGKYVGYDNAIFALAPYGHYWRNIRKIAITEMMSTHRVETLKHVRSSAIDTFIRDLNMVCQDQAPKVVIMSELMEHLTFSMNLKLIAGKQFSGRDYAEENSDACRIKRAIKEAVYLSGVFVVGDAIPWLDWMDFQGVGSMKRTFKEIDSVLGSWLEQHLLTKAKDSERDFMDVLLSKLSNDDDVASMSSHTRDTIVKATAFILIFTGAESTLVAMTWVVSLLLNHPKALRAAQEELDKQVGREKWVQESDIKNLKYLQAIVKETLRLNPPGPVTGLREAMEDCQIAGYNIPKGTRLIVNIWKLHRDPRLWEDPCKFQPERFLTTHANVDYVNGLHFGYMPFSFGRRSCPGMALGLQVVHLVLARLIQGFDLSTVGGMEVDMQEGLGIDLPKLKPLEVVIQPRLASHLYQSL